MKRILCALLAIIMILSLGACTKDPVTSSDVEGTVNSTVSDEKDNPSDVNSDDKTSTNNKNSSNKNSNKNSSNKKNSSVVKPSGSKVTTAKDSTGKKLELANPIAIAKGSKSMTEGLNFGGKTFKVALPTEALYQSDYFKRVITAFEKEYNCKLNLITVKFEEYNKTLGNALGAGEPFDLCFPHGSQFPANAVSGLYEDLTPYFTTADLDEGKGKGGIDLVKSSYTVYKDKLLSAINSEGLYPIVFYYNKKLFEAADLEDPRTLYENGQWSLTKLRSMGQKVTDVAGGVYFGTRDCSYRAIPMIYGVTPHTYKNGKIVININDANYIKGLKLAKTLTIGAKQIFERYDATAQVVSPFWDGTHYIHSEETMKWDEYARNAENSIAFGKSASNLAIVPIPQDKASAKRGYPAGWVTGTAAGSGSSDPRVAVAFSIFWSKFKDPVNNKYSLSTKDAELEYKLISGPLAFTHANCQNTSGYDINNLALYVVKDIISKNADITQTIEDALPKIQDCIDTTMK